MSSTVLYTVSMSRPHSHLFEVEAHFPAAPSLSVALPVWTPGSYLVREYARHVQNFAAFDADGNALEVTRSDKRTFDIHSNGKPVKITYQVYANELTVRTNHLDGSHGYFNGAALFVYAEALRHQPHRVRIVTPSGWSAYAALPQEADIFVAENYDELVDSPFEIGNYTPIDFSVANVPHRILLWGDPAVDAGKLERDIRRVCEKEAEMFGGLPMKQYLFIVHCTDKGRGGLEHKASTVLLFPRGNMGQPKPWEDFLSLVAHEYFHLWNVKRIKPKALVPFDYGQENYTTLLWAFEGITSYYDQQMVRRAELMSAQKYVTKLGETLSSLHATPGRKVLKLSDASLLAWIKHYRPDENSNNSAISYYLKGEVVAMLLDLTIRRATQDEKSLDDVMRLLWQRYGDESGVEEAGIEAAASEVAGINLQAFFDRAIRSTEELDYSVLSHVGLEARFREREAPSDKGGTPPRGKEPKVRGWLGVSTRGSVITGVVEGSPGMEAGLYVDDEVIALDGYKVDGNALISRCEDKKPNDKAKMTIFRRERMMEVSVTLGRAPQDAVYLVKTPMPSAQQKKSYTAWLKAPWDDTSAS